MVFIRSTWQGPNFVGDGSNWSPSNLDALTISVATHDFQRWWWNQFQVIKVALSMWDFAIFLLLPLTALHRPWRSTAAHCSEPVFQVGYKNWKILSFFLWWVVTSNENSMHTAKGQLISEWIYEAKTSPKKWTKNCKDFCPVSEGRNPCNFLFVFWEKFWLHKFILKLTDL